MTDYRPMCMRCKKRMECITVGVAIRYSETQVQFGDVYECPSCHALVVTGLSKPVTVRE